MAINPLLYIIYIMRIIEKGTRAWRDRANPLSGPSSGGRSVKIPLFTGIPDIRSR
jgi:hypothetical protein